MANETASAGATPAAAGATPTQTTPVSPAPDPTTTPATGDTDALGDPGKRAIDSMKAERDAAVRAQKAAEKARDDAVAATATDAEKALKAARDEATTTVTERLHAMIRRSEVKAALAGSGINPSVLDLAIGASEFAALKVSDDGTVEGLDQAVAQFKGSRGDLFKPAAAGGTADLGTGSASRSAAGKTFTREQLRDPAFYQANKLDIEQAAREGRITG